MLCRLNALMGFISCVLKPQHLQLIVKCTWERYILMYFYLFKTPICRRNEVKNKSDKWN